MKSGVPITRLLILTFTNMASKEMKDRIRESIKNDESLKEQLNLLDTAFITTFDSYALSIVKKYHYKVGVSNNIEIAESSIIDLKKIELMDKIFNSFYCKDDALFIKLITDFCIKDDKEIKDYILTISNNLDMKYDKIKLTNRNLLRRIWMKLFLCSHFSSVGSLIKEEIDNKKVAFIPTASLREGYTGYVGSARKLFNKLGAAVTEIDISTEAYLTIQSVFEDADVIYFTGGNSFFLMDQLRKTGTDELLKKELEKGKLMIGESAGAIICAPTIQYIEQMDEKPEDYSQEDDAGLDLIDFYVLPHYLTAPFKKVTEKIMTEFSDLNLCPINNRQGIVIDGEGSKVICKD